MFAGDSTKWDTTADIVVIGCGGAGAVAAISAHAAGSEVLILEKQPANSQITNTALSGGVFICPPDIEDAKKYVEELSRVDESLTWTNREVVSSWVKYMSENKEWVERTLGSSVIPFGNGAWTRYPGWESMMTYHYRGWGWGLMNALRTAIEANKIQILHNTSAKRLFANSKGEVVGVKAESKQGDELREVNIRVLKAVIMTCGGFEYNEPLKLHYLRVYPFYSHGTFSNTGDGIKMVLDLGADLWHMNCCTGRLLAKFPDFPISFAIDLGGKGSTVREASHKGTRNIAGFIIVDRGGRRYMSEELLPHYQHYEVNLFDSHRREYSRVPSYYIIDQKRIADGPLPYRIAGATGPCRLYKWSRDNLMRLRSVYIEHRERALINRQSDLAENQSASAQTEKDLIFRQLHEIESFKSKIDELLAEGYNPILDDGVGKNIAPLQKKGMIPYEVLNPGQLKKYLNADW